MSQHPTVRSSFFIRFLLVTAILGNFYLMLQSAMHSLNFHQLDVYLRWYGFNAAAWLNLVLFAGVSITLWGCTRIYKNGISSYKIYLIGKLLACLGLIVLMTAEYKTVSLPFPIILIPVLIGIESIYPVLLYISLRKSKAKR